MSDQEFKKLHLNQRVEQTVYSLIFETVTHFGYVSKLYNGNHQAQVWFDGEPNPRVVGKTQIELTNK